MTKIAIIVGSVRPGRYSRAVADWALTQAAGRADAEFEIVDLIDHPLPHLDEPAAASTGRYDNAHTKAWSQLIAGFDGFVFVTPEYNHSTTGVLKNAIDYLYAEWNNKAAGFVSFGVAGGVRAVEHLRLVAAEVQLATTKAQVALSFYTDFENFSTLTPGTHQTDAMTATFDQVVAWSEALAHLRK
ncbi:FMN reductase [Acrocarpospora corrugata]|uniref:FMN reductase n=1 Tax=Acrocarpospora corrugata TaxID=35763 RepID=A0A5M3VWS8_9ACTN|nr:NAD(P)H-dependent oxidoreductase [Acrocarpospora corrugata]GES01307.1 FMN reductase [Acrocarpospora corrugata]